MPNDAHISLVGNLISDPKNSQYNDSTVLTFGVSVATTKKKENSQYYETDIYNVSIWGKSGEFLMDKIQKGTMVWVDGELNMRTFKDRNGEEHTTPNVKANSVKVLAKGKGSGTTQKTAHKNEEAEEEPPF